MGNNLRLLTDDVIRRATLSSTNADANHPLANAADGRMDTLVKSTTTGGTWDFIADLGSGVTASVDTLVIERADLLVAVGATVELFDSADAAVYDSRFSEALGAPDLVAPALQHFIREYTTPGGKRAWRVRLTAGSGGVYAFAGLYLGLRYEVPKPPVYPVDLGPRRAHRGARFSFSYRNITHAQREALRTYKATVSPDHPSEQPMESPAGYVFGGQAHWLYDPIGAVGWTASGTAALMPVVLLNPETRASRTFVDANQDGPYEYAERV